MELRRLEYFVAVARERHFRRAAESFPIAQSALSYQIKELESELGVTLLARSTRQVDLTPAGEIFLEHAERVLDAVQQACRAALRADAGATSSLTVGFGSSVTCGLLPRLARTFRASHPEVDLKLHSEMAAATQLRALEQREIDIGFFRFQVATAKLSTEVIRRDRLIAVLPEHDALARRELLALADLASAAFVAYSESSDSSVRERIAAACAAAGFSPSIVQEADDTHTLVSLVAAGFGVAIVPDPVRDMRVPGIVYRDLTGAELEIDLSVAWRADDRRRTVQEFINMSRGITRDVALATV